MLSHAVASQCYQDILTSQQADLRTQLFEAAIRYAQFRAEWSLASLEQRREMDRPRSAAHDAFITACNVLARAMHAAGENTAWRDRLPDDRKAIGDFGCYVQLFRALEAR